MATKTITIDMEAYYRLKRNKQVNESFSQAIKRMIRRPIDFKQWIASIEKDPLSDKAADAIERVISDRSSRRNRRPPRGAA